MKFKFNFELLILYWSFVTYDPPCPVEPAVMPMRTSDSWGALLPHAPQSQCHHCLNATREPWCSATGKPGTHGEKKIHQNSAYISQHPVMAPIVNLSVLAGLVSLPASMVWPPVNPSCES